MENKRTISVYQVYHEDGYKYQLELYGHYKPYYTREEYPDNVYSINKYQSYINEFVAQYYIYKNQIKSDLVGFCHYNNKKFSLKRFFFRYGDDEKLKINKKLKELNYLDNDSIIAIGSLEQGINIFKNLDNYNKEKLYTYVRDNYPEFLNRLSKVEEVPPISFIRFEAFVCNWEDFNDYCKFMIGLIKHYGLDLDNISNEQEIIDKLDNFKIEYLDDGGWYTINHNRRIAYFIEFMCGLYWYLSGKNIIYNYIKYKY